MVIVRGGTVVNADGRARRDAARFGLATKGRIAPGADADLVVWDPVARWIAGPAHRASAADACVMDGRELRGDARTVLRRGSVAWQAGRLVAPAGSGRFLARSGLRREVAA